MTHDQIGAMTMADRIVAMHDGVIQQIGTPTEIYGRPVNRFVASFIGSPAMNFVDARAAHAADALRLDTAFGALALPAGSVPEGVSAVTLGVRPESVALGPPVPDGLGGTIDSLECMGATTLVHVKAGEARLRLMAFGFPAARAGDAVGLQVAPAALHLFDTASEVRLGP